MLLSGFITLFTAFINAASFSNGWTDDSQAESLSYSTQPCVTGTLSRASRRRRYGGVTASIIQPQVIGTLPHSNGIQPNGSPIYSAHPPMISTLPQVNGIQPNGSPIYSAHPPMISTLPQVNKVEQNKTSANPAHPRMISAPPQANKVKRNKVPIKTSIICTTDILLQDIKMMHHETNPNFTSLLSKLFKKNKNPECRYTNHKLSSFKICELLGIGSFGNVYLIKDKKTGKYSAVKEICRCKSKASPSRPISCLEARIQDSLRDGPFIARSYKYDNSPTDHLWIFMEYYEGKTLRYHFDKYLRFAEEVVIGICTKLLLALEHIHDKNILYNDIKLENILLDGQGHVKLTDFGLSERITEDKEARIGPWLLPIRVPGESFENDKGSHRGA